MALDKPDNLSRVWASDAPSGNIIDPDVDQPGKYTEGWTAEIPPFEYFNFIQQLLTQAVGYNNEQGVNEWDNETIYPLNAFAKSGSTTYRSIQDDNENNAVTDTEWWEVYISQSLINSINLKVQNVILTTFASSNTLGIDSDRAAIMYIGVGGGGAGGGTNTADSGTDVVGSGGGSGGMFMGMVTGANAQASATITIGAGGVGTSTTGGSGGTTSVVSSNYSISAEGGSGGRSTPTDGSAGNVYAVGGTAGFAGNVTGLVGAMLAGNVGHAGALASPNSGPITELGHGGGSFFGGASKVPLPTNFTTGAVQGSAGFAAGAGGAGSVKLNSSTVLDGGDGLGGFLIVISFLRD
jgi:hypothetical protein